MNGSVFQQGFIIQQHHLLSLKPEPQNLNKALYFFNLPEAPATDFRAGDSSRVLPQGKQLVSKEEKL